MKKNVLYLFALICAMSLFTSCGSDDSNDDNGSVAGVYSGTLNVNISNSGPLPSPQSVELTSPAKGKVNFLLKNFILKLTEDIDGATIPVGNIRINDIDLVPGDGKYTFTKTINDLKIEPGDVEGITEDQWLGPVLSKDGIPVTLNGTITGNNIKLDIAIPFTEDMNIAVDFTGTK